MTHRDLMWRGGGAMVFAAAIAIGFAGRVDGALTLAGFGLASAGLVLMVQGKRVAAAWRVERGRHRLLAQAIDTRRRRQSGRASGRGRH